MINLPKYFRSLSFTARQREILRAYLALAAENQKAQLEDASGYLLADRKEPVIFSFYCVNYFER
jgi:hypothetical protein